MIIIQIQLLLPQNIHIHLLLLLYYILCRLGQIGDYGINRYKTAYHNIILKKEKQVGQLADYFDLKGINIMLRGYGIQRQYINEHELFEDIVPDFYEYQDYPHTIPHKNRSKNIKNLKNEENKSIYENSGDIQE